MRTCTYSDFTIHTIAEGLVEKALKKSTPNKYAGAMFEAAEVIRHLMKENEQLKKKLEEG